jgi:hypothetical protein
MALNVLVLENEPQGAAVAEEELRDAGHTVLSCHNQGVADFPCRAVAQPSACPLRSHAVDVALVVRTGTRAQPTLGEDGARCALIHRVPLVVAGAPLFDPFDEYATRAIEHTFDVVATCEQAASAPIEAASRRATAVLDEVIGAAELHPAPGAVVRRRRGRLEAHVLRGEVLTASQRSQAAVRIVMALRELDPFAAGIDVVIDAAGDSTPPFTEGPRS